MYIGCRQKEGITLETSALETLYGQFKLSTQPIKPNYLGIPTPPSPLTPPTQHHSFFRNIPPPIFFSKRVNLNKVATKTNGRK